MSSKKSLEVWCELFGIGVLEFIVGEGKFEMAELDQGKLSEYFRNAVTLDIIETEVQNQMLEAVEIMDD